MNTIKSLCLAATLAATFTAHAADTQWVKLWDAKDVVFQAQAGSIQVAPSRIDRNLSVYSLRVRVIDTATNQIEFYRLAVRSDACESGAGQVGFFTLDGKVAKSDGEPAVVDFVIGGGSKGSDAAEALCELGAEIDPRLQKHRSASAKPFAI